VTGSSKPIKIRLTNDEGDVETPWATDLGPADGALKGSRRVRLVNVPYMHAKPTWGDVIVVSPDADGWLTWDGAGLEYEEIVEQLVEDGGRFAMIIHYVPHEGTSGLEASAALNRACKGDDGDGDARDVVYEGAIGPHADRPGVAYLAVRYALTPEDVMQRLRAAKPPCSVVQTHPVDETNQDPG
jgi:hypothetical protein